MCKASDTCYDFSHCPTTACAASPRAVIAELGHLAELTETAGSSPPQTPPH